MRRAGRVFLLVFRLLLSIHNAAHTRCIGALIICHRGLIGREEKQHGDGDKNAAHKNVITEMKHLSKQFTCDEMQIAGNLRFCTCFPEALWKTK